MIPFIDTLYKSLEPGAFVPERIVHRLFGQYGFGLDSDLVYRFHMSGWLLIRDDFGEAVRDMSSFGISASDLLRH